ncbi:DUF4280 domain-containing protein [Sinomicrobium weinanense]|uniref:DUF4280 domain-containing protein n=1 Tax=Sinomicrobium weinanense TaxID=2842200 RepID=A0A926JQ50_9FLAO|nr:DUF4280 domain-containing protein [Sinomicrobium weinanense]MBC9795269.1 DUF4280 domain-containing protein [Sinomicrobium weinanense]MBU3125741.1 DUF4280 domain-containing protein [Sinomicrobium weinanense]
MSNKIYVCDGAIVECDQGFNPAELKVTENTKIKVQGKLKATDMDRQVPKTFGKCKLKPTSGDYLPCVPALQKWTKTSEKTTLGGSKKFLFQDSECMCSTGGKITITDPLQVDSAGSVAEEFTELARMLPGAMLGADQAPKVVESYWMDEEGKERIKGSKYKENLKLYVLTSNVDPGTSVKLKVADDKQWDIEKGQKELIYKGTVMENGVAEMEMVTLKKEWKDTEEK